MADLLSSFSTVLSLTSRLREVSKNIEDAEFKNLIADLSLELADYKLKIAELVTENTELKEKLSELTSASGEICPKCRNRTYEIKSTKPHPIFGDMGTKERLYECSACNFSESRLIEP